MNKKIGNLLAGGGMILVSFAFTCFLILTSRIFKDISLLAIFGVIALSIIGIWFICDGVAERTRGQAALVSDLLENQTYRIARRDVVPSGCYFRLLLPDQTIRLLFISSEEMKTMEGMGDYISTRRSHEGEMQVISPPTVALA